MVTKLWGYYATKSSNRGGIRHCCQWRYPVDIGDITGPCPTLQVFRACRLKFLQVQHTLAGYTLQRVCREDHVKQHTKEEWVQSFVVHFPMMLGVKVTKVDLSWSPIHQEMALFYSVLYPVEVHVNCTGVRGWGWPISIRAR
eukprot:7184414-Ditylum_brightwellii.AAC.1